MTTADLTGPPHPNVFTARADATPAERATLVAFHHLHRERRIVGLTFAQDDELRQATLDCERLGLIQRVFA